MKRGAGARKGSAFEREVGKLLSRWITESDDSTQLIRSVLSGGWQAANWRQVGDLAPNGPVGERFRARFGVECKFHRSIDLWRLWTARAGSQLLLTWWRRLGDECTQHGLSPLLCFKANRTPTMVMFSSHLLSIRTVNGWLLSNVEVCASYPSIQAAVVQLDDLIQCDPVRLLEWSPWPSGDERYIDRP